MSEEPIEDSEEKPVEADLDQQTEDTGSPSPQLAKPPRLWWRRTFQIVLVLLIFVSGMVVGGLVTMHRMHHRMRNFEKDRPEIAFRILQRLNHEYHFSEEQKLQAKDIIERHLDDVVALRNEVRPRIESNFKKFEDEMGEIMEEEQREKWRHDIRHFGKRMFPRF